MKSKKIIGGRNKVELIGIVSKIYKLVSEDSFDIVITTMEKRKNGKKDAIISNVMCRFNGDIGSLKEGMKVRALGKVIGAEEFISENLKPFVIMDKLDRIVINLGFTERDIAEFLNEDDD